MLRHLHIENYTLIDRLDLEFHPGLNLLTGETGSGKSIVVEAVGLLLGGKASVELIRSGAERAQITGIFSPTGNRLSPQWKSLLSLLSDSGIEPDSGDEGADELIIQRDISTGGRSRVFVNHQPATAALLRNMAFFLAEVHGQNEQQELFSPAAQLQLLDRFGGITELAETVSERFGQWKQLRAQQENLARDQQDRLRQIDIWQFQKKEIEQAAIDPAEDEELEREKLLLVHAARIHANLSAAFDVLYDSPSSAVSGMGAAARSIGEVKQYDDTLPPLLESLEAARVAAEDVALGLRNRLSQIESSPDRLEEVEDRLALLDRLKRKYGPSLADVIGYRAGIATKLDEAESSEAQAEALEKQVEESAENYLKSAMELSRRRANAAKALKKDIESELRDLAMAGTSFEARLSVSDEEAAWTASGIDRVEFLISPNPGEPLRPLARIASGGEISRIMLALETVTDARRGPDGREHTLVFDEVDTGIGGRAAETVGRKLRKLGERRQVLCVTHLPQIASFAHHHYRVEKIESKGRTVTQVRYLRDGERTEELARMLSGSRITDAVKKHAEELLKANR